MNDLEKIIPQQVVISGALLVFIIKQVWELVMNRVKKQTQAMEKATDAIQELKLAIVELKTEMKWIREPVAEIPGIKKDLNNIGGKLRRMEASEQ